MVDQINKNQDSLKDGLPDIYSESNFFKIYNKCADFTMTSIERAHALYNACNFVIENKIQGDFVECGVWKGGSAMIIAETLKEKNVSDRNIYLYDTFDGMSEPDEVDKDLNYQNAKDLLMNNDRATSNVWSFATENEVRNNLFSTGYNKKKIIFIKGKVEETIPKVMPKEIALLRLDTDWYSSTLHELVHLYPKVSKSGILIIDDYGHWQGAKKAVDEYFKESKIPIFLNRIDYTGRLVVKP